MLKKLVLAVSLVLVTSGASWAAGAHEYLQCTGCHNIHYAKGPIIFEVAPNPKAMPEGAVSPDKSVAALCLGCHADADSGGMGIAPISMHTSHPWGKRVNLKVAKVPAALLRNGALDCVSCHDPHPSNPNYKYLRVNTQDGGQMRQFCAICHPAKADATAKPGSAMVFDSMNEETGAVSRPASELMQ